MYKNLAPLMILSLGLLTAPACGDSAGDTTSDGSDTQTDPASTDASDTDDGSDSQTGDDTTDPDTTTGDEYEGVLEGWCDAQADEFSFFVTSMGALWTLSGDDITELIGGFGGDFGGIEGADAICQEIGWATGHGDKTWRAFLSATDDGTGNPIHAIQRIGEGPWYDANGRLVASGLAGLSGERPDGDLQSTDDLPDECGVPISLLGDAHDVPTGSDEQGMLRSSDPDTTCNDWTSNAPGVGGDGINPGTVFCGHSFPREAGGGMGGMGGQNWVSDHPVRGCTPGANLIQNGPGEGDCIGCSGGYGALYCFAS